MSGQFSGIPKKEAVTEKPLVEKKETAQVSMIKLEKLRSSLWIDFVKGLAGLAQSSAIDIYRFVLHLIPLWQRAQEERSRTSCWNLCNSSAS